MILSKYHGYGNDFIIGVNNDDIDNKQLAISVCDRHTGIGADGLIMLDLKDGFEMMFYNADGSRCTMCGNGIRCLAKYIVDNGFVPKDCTSITIKTLSGIRTIEVDRDNYCVNMGKPIFNASSIGVTNTEILDDYELKFDNRTVKVNSCFMTNDHLVVIGDYNHDSALGKFLCENTLFTRGVNVNFVNVINQNEIFVETYERGVGWTLACGSGSCACFAVLNKKGIISDNVTVYLKLGSINVFLNDEKDVMMRGKATLVSKNIEYNF